MTRYKLGTIIIYKELWKAELAKKLFGEYNVVAIINGKPYEGNFLNTWRSADAWQLTLNTPEKSQWFMPQVGDKWESQDLTVTITNITADRVESCYGRVGAPSEDKAWCFATFFEIFTCRQRNGIAFPQPCEVIEPKD
jgi:hypothetical protein